MKGSEKLSFIINLNKFLNDNFHIFKYKIYKRILENYMTISNIIKTKSNLILIIFYEFFALIFF